MATILVVDDIPSNRAVLADLLGHFGHRLAEASDGAEALERARALRPDLVICDILMPTMDGFEFVSRLREEPAIAATKVLFYTAHYHEREAHSLALSCGVSEVLLKPVDPENVLRIVDRVLAGPGPVRTAEHAAAFEREHRRLVADRQAEGARAPGGAGERFAALTELNLSLASERDPEELLDAVCRGARRLIGARYAAIQVRSPDGRDPGFGRLAGYAPQPAGETEALALCEGSLGQPTPASRACRLHPLNGDAAVLGLPARLPAVRSLLAAPLLSPTAAYGWLCLLDKVGADGFSAEDESLLSIVAAQAGRIYENSRLVERISRHAGELALEVKERERAQVLTNTQYQVARLLASAGSLEEAAPRLLQLLGEGLGFEVGAVWRADPTGQHLRCIDTWENGAAPTARFAELTRSLLVSADSAAAWRAWESGRVVWVEDRRQQAASVRRELADQAGLGSIVAMPIQASGRCTGSIDLLAASVRPREEAVVDLLESVGRQVGLFVERTDQQRTVARLSRIYAVLSGINSLIVRTRDRRELFREACQIAVEHGKFAWAWLGEREGEDPGGTLACRATAGRREAEGESGEQAAADELPADTVALVAEALATARPCLANDLAPQDDRGAQAVPDADLAPPRAAAALPLVIGGRVSGVLLLLARERNCFHEGEMRLLGELAADIALGMEHITQEERLRYLAFHDPLTGLANRTLLEERLGQEIRRARKTGKSVALVLGGLNRFRSVNESFGRAAGDALLQEIARRLRGLWPHAANLARLSGDQFAGVLTDIDDPTTVALFLRSRMAPAVGAFFRHAGAEISPSMAAGIAIHPGDGEDADTLVKHAEAALARAKGQGERQLFYQPEMSARIAESLLIEGQMRRALDLGQFVLHYQPKVSAATGRLEGVEALIRWRGPDGHLVPPGRFVPILEETGLILEVGEWVVRQALADRARWRALGLAAPRVAVNVSAIQIRQPGFADAFQAVLAESGEAEPGIDVEITESLLMGDIEGNIAKLAALREFGVEVAIDDFGTGYSSLTYLARLPVDALKIDQSFIAAMGASPESLTIVSTIVTLARSLGLRSVAEGVETAQQANRLRALGCDQLQGYFLGRPVPFEELRAGLP